MSTIALVPPRTGIISLCSFLDSGRETCPSRKTLFELTSTSSLPHPLPAGLQRDDLGGNATLQHVHSPA